MAARLGPPTGTLPTRNRSGAADAVIYDLEDGVVPSPRLAARQALHLWFSPGATSWIRINPAGTEDRSRDLDAACSRTPVRVCTGCRDRRSRPRPPAARAPRLNVDDTTRIELLGALERVKNAACGAQALGRTRSTTPPAAKTPKPASPAIAAAAAVAAQLGLARSESHHAGHIHLDVAKTRRAELPNTLARLQDGTLSEWRATLIARETAHLSPIHRGNNDAALCKDPKTLQGWGNRRIVAETKKLASQLDPHAVVARNARPQRTPPNKPTAGSPAPPTTTPAYTPSTSPPPPGSPACPPPHPPPATTAASASSKTTSPRNSRPPKRRSRRARRESTPAI